MANVFDDDLATAVELIEEFGMVCGWQKPAPMVDNPDAPGYPTEGEVPKPVDVSIVFFSPRDLGRGSEEFLALLKGTEVPVGKEIGLMAGNTPFNPEDTDTIIRNGKPVAIQKLDLLAPNGMPILWFITVTS